MVQDYFLVWILEILFFFKTRNTPFIVALVLSCQISLLYGTVNLTVTRYVLFVQKQRLQTKKKCLLEVVRALTVLKSCFLERTAANDRILSDWYVIVEEQEILPTRNDR
jgi:hypothetical protein